MIKLKKIQASFRINFNSGHRIEFRLDPYVWLIGFSYNNRSYEIHYVEFNFLCFWICFWNDKDVI